MSGVAATTAKRLAPAQKAAKPGSVVAAPMATIPTASTTCVATSHPRLLPTRSTRGLQRNLDRALCAEQIDEGAPEELERHREVKPGCRADLRGCAAALRDELRPHLVQDR